MAKELIVRSTNLETKVALLEDGKLTEIFFERTKSRGILGNIYKGRVTKVLPGMQAAFVDIGLERHAFLYVSDFFEDHEEYEELFTPAEGSAGELTRPAGRRPPRGDPKRSRRSRKGRSSASKKPAPSASDASASPASPDKTTIGAAKGPPRQPKAGTDGKEFPSPLAAATLHILPDSLPQPDGAGEVSPSEETERATDRGILPDRLPDLTMKPSDSASGLERSSTGEARLKQEPPLDRLETRSPRRTNQNRCVTQPLIGDLLRENQEILVQVAKEPIGRKGARITSHVALPGRFLVFMPTVEHVGVSRKIVSDKERQRLKKIILELRGESGKGFIVRTVGENHSEEDFRADLQYLTQLWEDIRIKAEQVSAPGLVHAEPSLVHRIIRDYFSKEFSLVRVDDDLEYARIVEFVHRFNPELTTRIRPYNKNTPIFDKHGITGELEEALRSKVWLKNGGYIVINQTEALVAIDVNTGRFVGQTNSLEETITRTNLGAVQELVRQIRLRNLGGIIVIDFIDMDERKNRKKVIEALHEELCKDKSPSKILQFNEFGLVAITRRRVKQSLERTLCQPCTNCNGRGLTKSVRTICHSVYDEICKNLPELERGSEILIHCHPEVGEALQGRERFVLAEIEEMTGKTVTIQTNPLIHIEQFDIVEA